MTKKQLAALQRILDRERVAYQVRSDRPAPGQHPSENKYAITDGYVCVLMNSPCPGLPIGERADYLAKIVRNERKCGKHLPILCDQIDMRYWTEKAKYYSDSAYGITLFASAIHPDQLALDMGAAEGVSGRFHPQQLMDAAIAVGGNPLCFLGFGPLNGHFPSLLMFHPEWTERNCSEPIALVTSLRA